MENIQFADQIGAELSHSRQSLEPILCYCETASCVEVTTNFWTAPPAAMMISNWTAKSKAFEIAGAIASFRIFVYVGGLEFCISMALPLTVSGQYNNGSGIHFEIAVAPVRTADNQGFGTHD